MHNPLFVLRALAAANGDDNDNGSGGSSGDKGHVAVAVPVPPARSPLAVALAAATADAPARQPAPPPPRWKATLDAANICTALDPFTVPSASMRAEYASTRRPWGAALLALYAAACSLYFGILWRDNAALPDVAVLSSADASATPARAQFIPSSLVIPESVIASVFVPRSAELATPCAVGDGSGSGLPMSAFAGGLAYARSDVEPLNTGSRPWDVSGDSGIDVPLCPFTAGRIAGAPAQDVGGIAFILQLNLTCPSHTSVDAESFLYGLTLSDLMVANGHAADAVVGTVQHGASTLTLRASDVNARFCAAPPLARLARMMPSHGRIYDTASPAVAYAQVRRRVDVFANGSRVLSAPSWTLRATESDAWDTTGGGNDVQLPASTYKFSANTATISTTTFGVTQAVRTGRFANALWSLGSNVMAIVGPNFTQSTLADLTKTGLPSTSQILGGVFPPSQENAERLGNFTMHRMRPWWLQPNATVPPMQGSYGWNRTYEGAAACAFLDEMGVRYTPVENATDNPSMVLPPYTIVDNGAAAILRLWQAASSPTPPSVLPALQAERAAAGLGCGVHWKRLAQPQCRAATTNMYGAFTTLNWTMVAVNGTSLEEVAVLSCANGLALSRQLTSDQLPATADDDLATRIAITALGEAWSDGRWPQIYSSAPTTYTTDNRIGNLCLSGLCLSNTRGDVHTLLIVLAAESQADSVTYVSTRASPLTVLSQASGPCSLLWMAACMCKTALLLLEERGGAARAHKEATGV